MNERMMDAISRAKSRREGDIGNMPEAGSQTQSAEVGKANEVIESKPLLCLKSL